MNDLQRNLSFGSTEFSRKLINLEGSSFSEMVVPRLLEELQKSGSGQRFVLSQRWEIKTNLREILARKTKLVRSKAEVRRFIILKALETYGLMYESFLYGLFLGTHNNQTKRARAYKKTWGISAKQRMQQRFKDTPFGSKYATERKTRDMPYHDQSGQMSSSVSIKVSYFKNYGIKYSASMGDFEDIGYLHYGKWQKVGHRYYKDLAKQTRTPNLVDAFVMDDYKFKIRFKDVYRSELNRYSKLKGVTKDMINKLNTPGAFKERVR